MQITSHLNTLNLTDNLIRLLDSKILPLPSLSEEGQNPYSLSEDFIDITEFSVWLCHFSMLSLKWFNAPFLYATACSKVNMNFTHDHCFYSVHSEWQSYNMPNLQCKIWAGIKFFISKTIKNDYRILKNI